MLYILLAYQLIFTARDNRHCNHHDGFTAMHLAAREWNQDICEYLCAVAPECARVRDAVRV